MLKEKINNSDFLRPGVGCFEDLKREYPSFEEFFNKNKEEILFLMEDIQNEVQIQTPSGHVEVSSIASQLSYIYPSTSVFAAEDLLIALIDAKRDILRGIKQLNEDL